MDKCMLNFPDRSFGLCLIPAKCGKKCSKKKTVMFKVLQCLSILVKAKFLKAVI